VTDYAVIGGKEVVFVGEGGGRLFKYTVNDPADPLQDSWDLVGTFWEPYSGAGAGAYDSERNMFVRVAGSSLTYWDLDSAGPNNRNVIVTPADLSGGFDLDAFYGMEYDPVRSRFVLWDGDADIWYLTPPDQPARDGWTVEKAEIELGATGSPSEPDGFRGVLGKWDYVDKYDVFVGVTDSITGDVWAYKPEGWTPQLFSS
jgi:hypothetical protein